MSTTDRRPRLRPSVVVTAVLITVFLTVLAVAGFAAGGGGNDAAGAHPPVGADTVPESVRDGGPVVDATRTPVTSTSMPPMTIALTFDDGPDPEWTPEVLAVLRKYDVPATFFVVGSNVSRSPGIVKAIHASGSELGVHTFSHPDLVAVSRWRVDRELAETQLAIAGSAGVTTYLLRPPYSSSAEAIDDLGYRTVLAAGQDGYVSVFTTADSEDWQRPGVDAIVRNATPQPGAPTGSVVLMHDAGGDRSETVAALDRYIPAMKAAGYRFTTVTAGLGRPPANVPATPRDQLMGGVLLATLSVATSVVAALRWVLLVVGVLVVLRLVLMLGAARRQARRRRRPGWAWGPPVDRPVSVIVPAYNETKNIEATVRSILANAHPLEVIVVDDGSTDGTADLVEGLHLDRVRVIRQANAGKPVALNTGVRAAQHALVIMIDGDTVFEPDTVRLLAQPFADPAVGAVAGNVKIANRDELIGRLQHIEYVVGFNIDRRVQDALGSIATIPGAAGAFRRQALLDVGGLSTDTLAEDTDLTIALGRAGWRVVFEDRARAWTEAPATISQLWRQRFRWSYGTMQAIWKHRRAVGERGGAGQLGRRGLAHVMAFHILLPLTAPLVDIFFVYGLLFQDAATTLLLWLAMLVVQLGAALYAFHLEGEDKGTLWVLPVQQVMYRQLMYLVLMQSVVSAVTGARVRWQQMHRVGVLQDLMPPPPRPVAPVGARPVGAPLPPVAPRPAAPVARPPRERWLDVLVVVALTGLVGYTASGRDWTSLFPSAGLLFTVGGSLTALAVQRTPVVDVVGRGLRRLLVPMWALGIVAVPLMLWHGWAAETGDTTLYWANLIFWVFPVVDPPGSAWGLVATGGLSYLRVGVWLVLLAPVLARAVRRWPVPALLLPVAVLVVDRVLGWGLSSGSDLGPALVGFCTFAPCWMLGVAHRDGTLRRLHPAVWAAVTAAAIGVGAAWMWWSVTRIGSLDLTGNPVGTVLISCGVGLLLLRFSPRLGWVDRVGPLRWSLRLLCARLLTIYLLHPVALALAPGVATRVGLTSRPAVLGIAAAMVLVAVLAVGWVEDLAAGRPPRLLPRSAPSAPTTAGAPVPAPVFTAARTAPLRTPVPSLPLPRPPVARVPVSPPSVSRTSVFRPAVSAPSASQPSMLLPAVSRPAVSQPSLSGPSLSAPSVPPPSVPRPAVPLAATSRPSLSRTSASRSVESAPSASAPSAPPPSVPWPSVPAPRVSRPPVDRPPTPVPDGDSVRTAALPHVAPRDEPTRALPRIAVPQPTPSGDTGTPVRGPSR